MKQLAGIKFNEEEMKVIEKEYFEFGRKFIFRYKRVYQIHYSQNAGFYATELLNLRLGNGVVGYTRRGRHIITNADFGNRLIERENYLI